MQDAISSKERQIPAADGNNTEIVILSNTVRQRRARTPSSTNDNGNQSTEFFVNPTTTSSNNIHTVQQAQQNVLPDLLPKTFHLAESSSLFSQISSNDRTDNDEIYLDQQSNDINQNQRTDNQEQVFSVVEIRESNLTPKMSVQNFNVTEPTSSNSSKLVQKIGEIVNTISILESVDTFEPEYVETVNIVDASETSDTDTCSCSTPGLDEKRIRTSIDDLEDELERERCSVDPSVLIVEKQRTSFDEQRQPLPGKDRDLLKDEERLILKMPIAPYIKDILCSPERDSFYNSDKENNDEPLVFSEDEDIPRFSLEMTPDVDSDSDTVF